MRNHWLIPRRTALKGMGVSLALPLLDVMGWADPPKAGGFKMPVRLGFINTPNGFYPNNFWPKADTLDLLGALPSSLEPLRPLLADVLLLRGLGFNKNIDHPVAHTLEMSTWLTRVKPEPGPNPTMAISADQVAAQQLGLYTALPSLEIGHGGAGNGGVGQGGMANLLYKTMSWRSPTQPCPAERNPRGVFNRMFSSRQSASGKRGGPAVDTSRFAPAAAAAAGAGSAVVAGPPSLDQSMLDLVLENSKDFANRISTDDRHRLDDYMDNIRGLEKRVAAIERQQAAAAQQVRSRQAGKAPVSTSSPIIEVSIRETPTWSDWAMLMSDLVVLAFQADITRVVTLAYGTGDNNVPHPELGITDSHHDLSHHGNEADKVAKLCRVEQLKVKQFAYLVQRLKSLSEGGSTLLDNCIITFGSGIGHGAAHNFDALSIICAGRGGGTIRSGRYVRKCTGNFGDYLSAILARAGVQLAAPFGDGSKLLTDLS